MQQQCSRVRADRRSVHTNDLVIPHEAVVHRLASKVAVEPTHNQTTSGAHEQASLALRYLQAHAHDKEFR